MGSALAFAPSGSITLIASSLFFLVAAAFRGGRPSLAFVVADLQIGIFLTILLCALCAPPSVNSVLILS